MGIGQYLAQVYRTELLVAILLIPCILDVISLVDTMRQNYLAVNSIKFWVVCIFKSPSKSLVHISKYGSSGQISQTLYKTMYQQDKKNDIKTEIVECDRV